jgi:hypothetical protein
VCVRDWCMRVRKPHAHTRLHTRLHTRHIGSNTRLYTFIYTIVHASNTRLKPRIYTCMVHACNTRLQYTVVIHVTVVQYTHVNGYRHACMHVL